MGISSKLKLVRIGNLLDLWTPCTDLAAGDDRKFIDTMMQIIKNWPAGCAGLAAPQIGVFKRVIVTYCPDAVGTVRLRAMINPEIVDRSVQTDTSSEGTISFPGVKKDVTRHESIVCKWTGLDGRQFQSERVGFEARVIQHLMEYFEGFCLVGVLPAETQGGSSNEPGTEQ